MNNSSLRAGIIGLGVGQRHISGYSDNPNCEVVAICDINKSKLDEVAKSNPDLKLFTDPNELLADNSINIVSIASYDDSHCNQILNALDHNKHVFVEKPICLYRDEYNKIKTKLEIKKDLRLSANFVLRGIPRFVELKSRIITGMLGSLYYLEGDYDYGRLQKLTDGWRGDVKGYSVTHGGAIHLIDLLVWLTGRKIVEVFAYGNNISTKETKFIGNDLVTALLRFDNKIVAKVTANFGSVTSHFHKVSVYGTHGTFEQSQLGAAYSWSRDDQQILEYSEAAYPFSGVGRKNILSSFLKNLVEGTEPRITAEQILHVMNVSLAIDESIVSGLPIRI